MSASRSRKRRSRKLLAGLAVLIVLIAGGRYAASQDYLDDLDLWPGDPAPTAAPGGDTDVDADRARERLDALPVAEWSDMTGYSRERFPHWRTVDGCDVRQTVLARDGDDVVTEADSCRVVSGTWHSPFDGETLTDPGELDIDHIVPLANAWRTGADAWDDDRRADFANDLDTPQLIAVSASANRAKGDQDPSQWRPQRSYHCRYAHDWVAVKHSWELSVTEAERAALTDMLDTCE